MGSTSLPNLYPSPLASGRKDSIELPVAYLESSNPTEKERDKPGVAPETVKSLERRTEGWRVGLRDRETVDSDRSQENSDSSAATAVPDGSGTVWRGGVPLNTEGSPEVTNGDEDPDPDPDNRSTSLSLSSNPTPWETGSVSQPDRGCEG